MRMFFVIQTYMYTGQTFQEYIKYYLIFQSLFIGYQHDARGTFIEETLLYSIQISVSFLLPFTNLSVTTYT